MSKITKNVITTKTKYDNTASYQGDDTNAYVPLTDVLIAGEGVSVTTDAQGRVVVSASGGGGGGGLNEYTYSFTTTYNFQRIENIILNAKGKILINLLGLYELIYSGYGSDGDVTEYYFSMINGTSGGLMAINFAIGSDNFKGNQVTITAASTSVQDISSYITNATITYFNDTEITQ